MSGGKCSKTTIINLDYILVSLTLLLKFSKQLAHRWAICKLSDGINWGLGKITKERKGIEYVGS